MDITMDDATPATPPPDATPDATPAEPSATVVLDSTANPVDPTVTTVSVSATEADAATLADAVHSPAPVDAYATPGVNTSTDSAVSGNPTDDVLFSRCVYKNVNVRKSLTIHHLQRRLNALGFSDAYADEDGFYGDLTQLSVQNFQKAKGLEVTEVIDANTFSLIFEGDANVVVVLDSI